MRRSPTDWSTTSPASLSTLRCCETAGRLTGRPLASSPTAYGRLASRSKIVCLVRSPRADHAASWSVVTHRKVMLTGLACQPGRTTTFRTRRARRPASRSTSENGAQYVRVRALYVRTAQRMRPISHRRGTPRAVHGETHLFAEVPVVVALNDGETTGTLRQQAGSGSEWHRHLGIDQIERPVDAHDRDLAEVAPVVAGERPDAPSRVSMGGLGGVIPSPDDPRRAVENRVEREARHRTVGVVEHCRCQAPLG